MKNRKLQKDREFVSSQIQERINRGRRLLETPVTSENELKNLEFETEKWCGYNITLFENLFVESPLSVFTHGNKMVRSVYRENQIYNGTKEHKFYLTNWINDLESIYEQLELYEETTLIREKLHYIKTQTTKIKEFGKYMLTHWKQGIIGIISSIIGGIILIHIGC